MLQNNQLNPAVSPLGAPLPFGNFDIFFKEPVWETPDTEAIGQFRGYMDLPSFHLQHDDDIRHDLFLCLRGRGRLELDGTMHAIERGSVWFTSPISRLYWHEYNKQETLILHIPFTLLRKRSAGDVAQQDMLFFDFLQRISDSTDSSSLIGYDQTLCEYSDFLKQRMTVANRFGFQSLLLSLLMDSLQALNSTERPVTDAQFIASYVKANVLQKITVGDLAKLLSVSERSLFYIFTKNFNASPNDYINRTRMDAAAEHLAKGLTVREVSELFKFTESTSFCRMFKKYHGVTPSDYQKAALGGNIPSKDQ